MSEMTQTEKIEALTKIKKSLCEGSYGGKADVKLRELQGVSGFWRSLFRDPFGIEKAQLEKDLGVIRADGKACVANAQSEATAEVIRNAATKRADR